MTTHDLMSALALVGFLVCVAAFGLAMITPRLTRERADTIMALAVGMFGFGAFVFVASYVTTQA